jgi:hypothetical protein
MPDATKKMQSKEELVIVPEITTTGIDVPLTTPETLSNQEQPPTPTTPIEKKQTREEGRFMDEAIEGLRKTLKKPKKQKAVPQMRDDITMQVENIMSSGLTDAYKIMTPVQQQEFKLKGEKAAMLIRDLLRGTHVKVRKIFQIILDWLKLLPGVNKFFLEQEAKIKADKILALNHMNKKE